MPLLTQTKKSNGRRQVRAPQPKTTDRAAMRAAFARLVAAAATEIRAIRRARQSAATRAAQSGSLEPVRELVSLLVHFASMLRNLASRLEREAQSLMREAEAARKTLPKLLEPRRITVDGFEVALFELGQPLTAREAFAEALDVSAGEATLRALGERRAFVPRRAADRIIGDARTPTIVLTRLRGRERPTVFGAGKHGKLRGPRGGAVLARDGFPAMFYFPGVARMPAGSVIALPAASLTA